MMSSGQEMSRYEDALMWAHRERSGRGWMEPAPDAAPVSATPFLWLVVAVLFVLLRHVL